MAWARVQATSAATVAATFASTTTSGSLLHVWVLGSHSAGCPLPNSVSDTQGNTWVQGPTVTAAGGIVRATEFHCVNSGARASDVVTVNYTTNPDYGNLTVIEEFTGNAASSPYDQGAGVATSPGSSAANGNTTSSVTTTTNGQLISGFIADVAGANWTGVTPGTSPITFTESLDGGASSWETEYGTQTSAGAITAKWTCSNTDAYVALIATFKAAAAGGGNPWNYYAQQ